MFGSTIDLTAMVAVLVSGLGLDPTLWKEECTCGFSDSSVLCPMTCFQVQPTKALLT